MCLARPRVGPSKYEGRKEPGRRPWRDAPSSGRRRLKAPVRGGPVGAAARGGTAHARRPLSASGALRGVPAGRGRPRSQARPQGKAFPLPDISMRKRIFRAGPGVPGYAGFVVLIALTRWSSMPSSWLRNVLFWVNPAAPHPCTWGHPLPVLGFARGRPHVHPQGPPHPLKSERRGRIFATSDHEFSP